MAKKVRKMPGKAKTKLKKPAKPKAGSKAKAKARSKPGAVSRAYRAVVGTVTETDKLRNKLEQPGTSESE